MVHHLAASLTRLLVGYALAVLVGLPAGAVLSNWVGLGSVVRLFMGTPTLVWVPVFLVTLGLGDKTVVAAIFVSAVFAVMLNVAQGISQVDRDVVGAAQLDGASGLTLLAGVLLPCAKLQVLAGLRLAIGYSWRALVGAEMLAAMVKFGLGKLVWEARYWQDMSTMLIGLAMIAVCGAMLDGVLRYATD